MVRALQIDIEDGPYHVNSRGWEGRNRSRGTVPIFAAIENREYSSWITRFGRENGTVLFARYAAVW